MDIKSPSRADISADYQAVMAEMADLRAELANLAHHMTQATGAGISAGPAKLAATLTDEATHLIDATTAKAKSSAGAIEAQIEAHPVASLLLAFAAGFVGSRLLAR